MDILCSVGKGQLSIDICLQCALNRDPGWTCGFDYVLLKKMFDTQDRSKEVHVTDLLGCQKRAYLGKVSAAPEYVHEKLTRTLGIVTHDGLAHSDGNVDCELPLKDGDLVGTADIVYKNGRVVDIKTTRWIYLDKLPYGSHTEQVNIYAHILIKGGREVNSLAIQYIDMSGPTKCRACKLPVRWTEDGLACPKCGKSPKGAHLGAALVEIPLWEYDYAEEFIQSKLAKLQKALKEKVQPPAEAGYLCGYCSFLDTCFEGQLFNE